MSVGVERRLKLWPSWPLCPCGCGAEGKRLSSLTGHLARDCVCRSCIGRRNQAKGKRGQATMHKALGGTGFTPSNEESGRPYPVMVLPESKAGGQVPGAFHKFIGTDWFRRALSQAERGAPIGSGVKPAVVIDGRWLIVDLRARTP